MEKLTVNDPETRSTDSVGDNLKGLHALFPEAFTEGKIDFIVLRQLLSGEIDDRDEKYGLKWNGKTSGATTRSNAFGRHLAPVHRGKRRLGYDTEPGDRG